MVCPRLEKLIGTRESPKLLQYLFQYLYYNGRMRLYRLALITLLLQPLAVWAIDLQPNDIVAPLPGKSHVMVSYVNSESGTYYANGSQSSRAFLKSPDIST